MARTTIPAELVAINAIQGTLIADNAITAVHIATNAVSGTLVADNAITSTHIAQNNVTATQIAMNTITVTQMADNAVETAKINNDAVTQAKIADDAVGADQLASNSVTSASIVNGTIVAADLADNAVTLAKMASLARGKIIYGDSAGDPAALAVGSNGQVLTTDGTDISWGAVSGGVDGISSSADATAITIDSSERVGIGQGTPTTPLHVESSTSNQNTTLIKNTAGTGVNYGLEIQAGTNATDHALQVLDSGGTSRLRVTGAGNVGINTTGPLAQLEIDPAAVDTAIFAIRREDHATIPLFKFFQDSSVSQGTGHAHMNTGNRDLSITTDTNATKTNGLYITTTGKTIIGDSASHTDDLFQIETPASGGGHGIQIRRNDSNNDQGIGRIMFGNNTDTDLATLSAVTDGDTDCARLVFSTQDSGGSSAERMRLDQYGRLLINKTVSSLTYGKLQVEAGGETAGHGGIVFFADTDTSVGSSNVIQVLWFSGDNDATGGVFTRFRDGNSILGQIEAANGTQVSYGVSSDERLKENIVDASSQLNTIKNIKVREFDWKANGYHEVGMIAQELHTVIPSAVQEGGDDINEEPWGVDYSKLTPYLIKALQEQQTTIESLTARIEKLES